MKLGPTINFPEDMPYEEAVKILGKPIADILYKEKQPFESKVLNVTKVDKTNKTITVEMKE